MMPTTPGRWMAPGMMPILQAPGVTTPGQFGPISRASGYPASAAFAASMSSTGTPSVMQTMMRIPASAASRMASAAWAAGT